MFAILGKWMMDTLNMVLPDEHSVGSALQNGEIIAKLLDRYGVSKYSLLIRKENKSRQRKMRRSDYIKQCFDRWLHLNNYLALVDCKLDYKSLLDLAHGKNSRAIKFMLQLYVSLDSLQNAFTCETCGLPLFPQPLPPAVGDSLISESFTSELICNCIFPVEARPTFVDSFMQDFVEFDKLVKREEDKRFFSRYEPIPFEEMLLEDVPPCKDELPHLNHYQMFVQGTDEVHSSVSRFQSYKESDDTGSELVAKEDYQDVEQESEYVDDDIVLLDKYVYPPPSLPKYIEPSTSLPKESGNKHHCEPWHICLSSNLPNKYDNDVQEEQSQDEMNENNDPPESLPKESEYGEHCNSWEICVSSYSNNTATHGDSRRCEESDKETKKKCAEKEINIDESEIKKIIETTGYEIKLFENREDQLVLKTKDYFVEDFKYVCSYYNKLEKCRYRAMRCLKAQQHNILEYLHLMRNIREKEVRLCDQTLLTELDIRLTDKDIKVIEEIEWDERGGGEEEDSDESCEMYGDLIGIYNLEKSQIRKSEKDERKQEKIWQHIINLEEDKTVQYFYEVSHSTTEDLILLAMKLGSYGTIDVPDVVLKQWKQAFLIGRCDIEMNIDIGPSDTFRENESEDTIADYCTSLSKANVYDYFNFQGDWFLDPASMPTRERDEEALGYIVTKLMLHSTPEPIPSPPFLPDFPGFCVCGIPEDSYLEFKKYLENNHVLFVSVEQVIDYCVGEYKKKSAPLISVFKNQKENSSSDLSCTDKTSRTSLEEAHHPRMLSSRDNTSLEDNVLNPLHATKETQTPYEIPEPPSFPPLQTALVGEIIFRKFAQGEQADAELVVEALLCFLSEKALTQLIPEAVKWRAWALVNFPDNLNHACEMESRLLGQFVPVKIERNARRQKHIKSRLAPCVVNYFDGSLFAPYISEYIDVHTEIETSEESRLVQNFYSRFTRFNLLMRDPYKNLFESVLEAILIKSKTKSLSPIPSTNSTNFTSIQLLFVKPSRGSSTDEDYIMKSQDSVSAVPERAEEPKQAVDIIKEVTPESKIFLKKYFDGDDFEKPTQVLSGLGELWRHMESEYFHTIELAFSVVKQEHSQLLPLAYQMQKMFRDVYIIPDDEKQKLVDDFQTKFNRIFKDKTVSRNTKDYFYRETLILLRKLFEICDHHQEFYREGVAFEIVKGKWFVHYITVLTTSALTLVKAEVRRLVDTMQILSDYLYLAMDKLPSPAGEPYQIDVLEIFNSFLIEDRDLEHLEFVTAKGFFVSTYILYEAIASTFTYYTEMIRSQSLDYPEIFDKLEIPEEFSNPKIPEEHPQQLFEDIKTIVSNAKQRAELKLDLIRQNLETEMRMFEQWCLNLLNDEFDITVYKHHQEIEAIKALYGILWIHIEDCILPDRRFLLSFVQNQKPK